MSDNGEMKQSSADHKCLQSLIEVFLYIDGQLDNEREAEINGHLNQCTECYGKVEFERLVRGYIKTKSLNDAPSTTVVNSVTSMFKS